jgi:uncharacterized protein (DUF1800 family)
MPALSTTRRRVQHLLRRAVERLLAPEAVDDAAAAEAVAALDLDLDLEQRRIGLWQAWHVRLEQSRRPLLEKLTYFWHDHFATAIHKVGRPELMQLQNETLRRRALGSFRDLLLAITRDPAMMRWLDNGTNTREAPNENYARELLELHTMGADNGYTEADIKEAARALTGWRITPFGPRFFARRHDPGEKTVLGVTGALNDADVVDILAERPETAELIGRKLWRLFAVPEPGPALIERTSAAYFASGGEIRELVREILLSDEMYSDAAYRTRIKAPVELVIGTARALEVPSDGRVEKVFLERMGQRLYDPPNPAGWTGGPAWINSNTMLTRSNFADLLTRSPAPRGARGRDARGGVDVAALLRRHGATGSAEEVVDWTLELLVGGDVDADSRDVLIEHLGGPHHFDFEEAAEDGSLRGMLYLALAMPLYQLT